MDVVNMLQLREWGQGDAYKSELWLVDTVHEGYLAWALIDQVRISYSLNTYLGQASARFYSTGVQRLDNSINVQ